MGKLVKKLIPYSVYLPEDYYEKIKILAKHRKASSTIRDAITMIIDGRDEYKAGYNQGLRDCIKEIDKIKEIRVIAVSGKYVNDLLYDSISKLESK